jgi:hypothetical protein
MPSVGRPAALATSPVIRSSPVAACEARCAAMLTGSPSDADEGAARVDAGAEREPRTVGGAVARRAQQRDRGVHRAARVLLADEEGDEQADHLVADELLDDRVVLDEDVRRLAVETVHEARELDRRHRARDLARPSDVGEQHRDIDFPAADLAVLGAGAHPRVRLEPLEAPPADTRLLGPRREPVPPQEEPAGAAEGCLAELAPRARRDEPERRLVVQMRMRPAQERGPLLLWRGVVAHRGR